MEKEDSSGQKGALKLVQVENLDEASRGETTQGGGGGAKLEMIKEESSSSQLREHMGGTSADATSLRKEKSQTDADGGLERQVAGVGDNNG